MVVTQQKNTVDRKVIQYLADLKPFATVGLAEKHFLPDTAKFRPDYLTFFASF